EITENFKGAESAGVVDYRGLDVAEITALRKELRDNNVTYKVYKNTMVKRAVADAELEDLNDILVGPTAIAFGHDDVVAPARIVYDYAKDHEDLVINRCVILDTYASVELLI